MAQPVRSYGPAWTYVIAAVAAFMVNLDNLVVTTALPSIRTHLHSGVQGLEWVVNAYTLTFAVLLLTGAALGDRFGRRRMLAIGLGIFTAASATAALAPTTSVLVAARAVQGVGGAIVLPLTLTVLSHAASPERRAAVLGLFGAIGGLAVAVGPLVGGAVTQAMSWHWIFWLNVPIGLVVLPLVGRIGESWGPQGQLDLRGVLLGSAGLLGIVYGLVRTDTSGWTSPQVVVPLLAGAGVLAAFLRHEQRTSHPMLPLRLFRDRTFGAANLATLLFSFGMFGAIFLLAQFLQTVQHFSPLAAGLRTLPWTAMPMIVAPLAAPLSARLGARPFLVSGLALQAAGLAWLAELLRPSVPFTDLVVPFVLCGVGMSLFFVPVANVVLSAVRPAEEGVASGANNAIRELGGVLGIAVLVSIFAAHGSYSSGHAFIAGARPAVAAGAVIVAIGAGVAALVRRPRSPEVEVEVVPAELELVA
jgi:EmrB/QacA subfamily drug resistance transporter